MSRPATATGRTRAAGLVAAGILASRLSGLVRERVFAHYFGATGVADAWRAALRAPNVLQNLLGEGTLSASFIPVYAELVGEGRDREAARFAGAILGLLAIVAAGLALVGILAAPLLVEILFAGFDPARRELTTALVRILFPMAAILAVSAWSLGILNSHRRFFLPYAAPVLWNGAMIAAVVVAAVRFEASGEALARALAWGALAGGVLQLAVQLPTALRLLGEFRPSPSLAVPGVRDAIRGFFPAVAGRGAVNLSAYLDYFLASFLAVGATAVLGYAQTLYLLPISLFGLSVAASELPELSRDRGRGKAVLADGVERGALRALYFLVPSVAAYLLLGDVIVALLFRTGSFGEPEVLVTWAVLATYAMGIPASALSRLTASAFYALRDTRTPARVAYLRVAVSFAVGVGLMLPLDDVTIGGLGLGAVGLAAGAAAGSWVEWALLSRALRARLGGLELPAAALARLLGAAALAGVAGFAGSVILDGTAPWIEAAGTLLPFGGVYLLATSGLRASALGTPNGGPPNRGAPDRGPSDRPA